MDLRQLKNKKFYFIMAGVFILIYILQNVNGRFGLCDFEVYYSAARNLIHGKDIYGIAFGEPSGFFKYSPTSVFLFIPFVFLPFFAAKTVYFFIVGLFIVLVIEKIIRLLKEYLGLNEIHETKLKIFILLIAGIHFHRELHVGNINVILIFIVLSVLALLLKEKKIAASMLIGLAIIIKPHFVLLLPLLLIRKDIRTFVLSIFFTFIYLTIPSLFFGMAKNINLLVEWKNAMAEHNSAEGLVQYTTTLHHAFYYSIGKYFWGTNYTMVAVFVTSVVALAVLILILTNYQKENKDKEMAKRNFIYEFILIMALIPSITKTDTEHFLFSIPLIMYILTMLTQKVIKSKVILVAAIIGFLMYGGKESNLLGNHFAEIAANIGIIGLGNLWLIIVSLVIFLQRNKYLEPVKE